MCMEIKRVEADDRICVFTDVEFSNYATDCDVELNFEEFCFAAEENGNLAGVIIGRAYYNEIHIGAVLHTRQDLQTALKFVEIYFK